MLKSRLVVVNEATGQTQKRGGERFDIRRFTLADMVMCGGMLRRIVGGSRSMEEAAQELTQHLYESFRDRISQERAFVLVRFFRTWAFENLDADLQNQAKSGKRDEISHDTKCLTLLGTAGDEPAWNARRMSQGHQCIPLLSEEIVGQFPMIAQLIKQLGLTTSELLQSSPELVKILESKNFGVFYVPGAPGSPYVPAQENFVAPHRVQSVLGFGGIMPDGDLFATILFARVQIPSAVAEMFRTIALSLKLGLLALANKPVLAEPK